MYSGDFGVDFLAAYDRQPHASSAKPFRRAGLRPPAQCQPAQCQPAQCQPAQCQPAQCQPARGPATRTVEPAPTIRSRLGSLAGHPEVIINRYYNPFGADIGCITNQGLTVAKVRTLSTWLNALNQVLAKGAAQFGFLSPQPSFAGHQLCSQQPYVQGLTAGAP
jgi:hypothetical protein